MKVVALFVSLLLSVSLSPTCAQTISPQETPSHIGQTVTVEGIVDVVYTSRAGNTFLNFGGRFPNQTFTGFIPAADTPNFPNVHSLEGKPIRIKGPLQLYNGKPEIILHSPLQLVPE
jgi:DNA/RNA endonuclease YhcR with UshA esterase domain